MSCVSFVGPCSVRQVCWVLYDWLGGCRWPSYWNTRNRSIDKRPTWRQTQWRSTGSFANAIKVNTGGALSFVKAGWRVPSDRFLVPQYEGVWHAPSRREARLLRTEPSNASTAVSSPLKNRRNPLPTANAHGHQGVSALDAFQLVQRLDRNQRARGTDRVAE